MSVLSPVDKVGNLRLVKSIINSLYPDDMQVLRDLTFVQAILEAGLKRTPPSVLALKYNNLFGIKGQGTKGSITLYTREQYLMSPVAFKEAVAKNRKVKVIKQGDNMITVEEDLPQAFAQNASVEDSIKQHIALLAKPRYAAVRTAKTFEIAAQAIRDAGYATDMTYPQKLIAVYKDYVLTKDL